MVKRQSLVFGLHLNVYHWRMAAFQQEQERQDHEIVYIVRQLHLARKGKEQNRNYEEILRRKRPPESDQKVWFLKRFSAMRLKEPERLVLDMVQRVHQYEVDVQACPFVLAIVSPVTPVCRQEIRQKKRRAFLMLIQI